MSAVRAARQDQRWTDIDHDGWAILAQPPGRRDLGCPELWERSLARSQRRRDLAAGRRRVAQRGTLVKVSAALAVATVAAPAGQMAAAQATTAGATSTLLRTGSRGPAVAAAQRALGIGADGVFGPQTRRAVKQFQRGHGLEVDGVIGPVTARALGVSGGSASRGSGRSVSRGHARGPAPSASVTAAIQRKLGLSADGVYGPMTRAAVKRFQRSHGLQADGVVGPQTLAALGLSGSPAPGTRSAPAPASSGVSAAVAAARSKLGTPYVSAGVGPNGFDCSGLTMWAMRQGGISLPRTSYAQYGVGSAVSRRSIQGGDLVFFDTSGGGASHVGIATSAGTVISATTHGVMQHSISDSYWGSHYVGARRV